MSIEKDNNMASEKIGSQTAIDVADLHKSFAKGKKAEDEVRVLDGVSFTVPSGSIVAFLGHNGAENYVGSNLIDAYYEGFRHSYGLR